MHISLFILYVYNLYSTHFLKDEMNSNAYKCVHVCVSVWCVGGGAQRHRMNIFGGPRGQTSLRGSVRAASCFQAEEPSLRLSQNIQPHSANINRLLPVELHYG